MLFELDVLNGVMTPKFDKYNNIYSVSITDNVTNLMLKYKANDDAYVKVIGNDNLLPGNNIVLIEVNENEETNTYKLLVYKEYTEEVFKEVSLETNNIKEEVPEYVAPLIMCICFLIIAITYLVLFRKKH